MKRIVFILVLVSVAGRAVAQDTLDLLDALAIVRDTYGEEVVVLEAEHNDDLACWSFELEDGTKACVSDTTGEFVSLTEAQTRFPSQGLVLIGGLLGAVTLAYIWVRRSTAPLIRSGEADGSFSLTLRSAYSVDRITMWLAAIASYLAVQSIIARRIQEGFGDAPRVVDRVVRFVNINLESSLPTWYASVLLLLSAVLVGLIAHRKKNDSYRLHWSGLSAIFVYLSIDEATALHEELTVPLRNALDASGFLHFAWVIVGVLFFVAVALLYARFLFHLPPPVRNLVILGAGVFIGGALVLESYSADLYAESGTTLSYSAIGTAEELLEMLGVVLFIRAMLFYLQFYEQPAQVL